MSDQFPPGDPKDVFNSSINSYPKGTWPSEKLSVEESEKEKFSFKSEDEEEESIQFFPGKELRMFLLHPPPPPPFEGKTVARIEVF